MVSPYRVAEKSIFPTEMKLTKEYSQIGALASALEMIKTGSTFACDMYHFPESIVSALNEAGLRGIVCGPQTQWPLEKVEMMAPSEKN